MTASDERAIEDGLYRVAAALDARDWAALGSAFTPEACGYGAAGRDAIVARVRAHLGGCGPSQHLLGNVRVRVDGDTASSLTYARVHHVGVGDRAGSFYECMGEYSDTWARTAEGWQLTGRRFTVTIELGDRSVLQPG
ncbi:nuclear transport factor 2 family protein [Geodermatophilus chilensis]|jgi:3-phenylpropionate/cinnamic acid dioxygenase small subunit|uniref:nuclear transport factor 2 family protein n=1 Tax=Geodermatophilus chilensis TaxID=2035835 RepID=UPI000C26A649|nr:nuclear transport factor 2 family protein [Geodermatophilus chilensis]